MSFSPRKLCIGLVLLAAQLCGAATSEPASQPLQTVRTQDQVTIHATTSLLSFTQTIVFETVAVNREREKPGTTNFVQLLLHPLWIKEGDALRPAFRVLKPRLNLSHGRIRRFMLVQPDGESVTSVNAITPDCAYVLTLDFGHIVPKRFTVTLDLATGGITRDMELTYKPSNDGHPARSGPPESFYTELRVFPDGPLQPWKVLQAGLPLARINSSTVRLERNVDSTIRFGANAE